ncbi:MAG: four helix bundle protein [Saprospiraceae bacterium]|jgi:four helix bundle protein|nr:four helix bundle protein [Saprospiraceae bacterium]
MTNEEFAEQFKTRTKRWAVAVVQYVMALPETSVTRVVRYQLIKASTSTAANYRAACRGRSHADFHAKIGICLEEGDESLFWMEFIQEASIDDSPALRTLMTEGLEIVSILAKARKNSSR